MDFSNLKIQLPRTRIYSSKESYIVKNAYTPIYVYIPVLCMLLCQDTQEIKIKAYIAPSPSPSPPPQPMEDKPKPDNLVNHVQPQAHSQSYLNMALYPITLKVSSHFHQLISSKFLFTTAIHLNSTFFAV